MELTLRTRTIVIVSACLLLFHIASLAFYILLSAETVTLEREELVADRIVATTRLLEQAPPADRARLATQSSGEKFYVSIDPEPLEAGGEAESGAEITGLIHQRITPVEHVVAADYYETDFESAREITARRSSGPFRIHETLIVSIDLAGGGWLNFRVSGSAWNHIFAPAAVPSLTIMAIGTIVLAAWASGHTLNSLSNFARASDAMGEDIEGAAPLNETGPMEIRQAARAFNRMQTRVQSLLRARNEMLAAISHDFRTPLTRLRLRMEHIEDDTQRIKAIHDIEEMDALIRFNLEFAWMNARGLDKETIQFASLVARVVQQLDSPKIAVNIPEDLSVAGHPVGLRRVITNLVENGLFHAQQVTVTARLSDGELIIDVDDNGPGIAVAHREDVFTPFHRLEGSRNRETGGTGLGLSIVQKIVIAHGGSIELNDSSLGGLNVHIILPGATRFYSKKSLVN